MRILTVYYSRSGNTERVAEKIAKTLGSEIDRIIDRKDRDRIINGWLIAGKDAKQRMQTDIDHNEDPQDYDLVIIGTPVWAWTMSPAVRTYMDKHPFRKVAFFCTYGALKGKTFDEMEDLSKKPLKTLGINGMKVNTMQSEKRIQEFCSSILHEMKAPEMPAS